jgi:hypothetical protein
MLNPGGNVQLAYEGRPSGSVGEAVESGRSRDTGIHPTPGRRGQATTPNEPVEMTEPTTTLTRIAPDGRYERFTI